MLSIRGDDLLLKTAYNGEFSQHAILKRGKRWQQFSPAPLPLESTVKAAKNTDVRSLLAAIGASPAVCGFYDAALSTNELAVPNASSDSDAEADES